MNFARENERRIQNFWKQMEQTPLLNNHMHNYRFPRNNQTPVSSALDSSFIPDIYDLHSQNKLQTTSILNDHHNSHIPTAIDGNNIGLLMTNKFDDTGNTKIIKLGEFSSKSTKKGKKSIKILNIERVKIINQNRNNVVKQQNYSKSNICFSCCWTDKNDKINNQQADLCPQYPTRKGKNWRQHTAQKRKIKQIVSLQGKRTKSGCKSHQSKTTLFEKGSQDKMIVALPNPQSKRHKKTQSNPHWSGKQTKIQLFDI